MSLLIYLLLTGKLSTPAPKVLINLTYKYQEDEIFFHTQVTG